MCAPPPPTHTTTTTTAASAGSLPPALARLPALLHLDVSGNALSGSLAPWAEALAATAGSGGGSSLLQMNASRNRLYGAIPDSLAEAPLFNAERVPASRRGCGGKMAASAPTQEALCATSPTAAGAAATCIALPPPPLVVRSCVYPHHQLRLWFEVLVLTHLRFRLDQ